MMTPREQTYLNFFTDGNVSLDYLKKIVVRNRIHKSEKNQMLEWFPNFLTLPTDFMEDQYDTAYYSLPAVEIRSALTNVISYIENSLFAQDIAILNDFSYKFDKSISINEGSKKKLQEEKNKLESARLELEDTLIEAKKFYTAYEILKKNMENKPDPVLAYQQEVLAQIEDKLAKDSLIALALQNQQNSTNETTAQAQELAKQLEIAQKLNNEKIAKDIKDAEIAYQKALNDAKIAEENAKNSFAVNPINATAQTETKKSSILPLAVGGGILAFFLLSGGE